MVISNSKILLVFLQILAFWSVWRWYYLRHSTSNEEFFGVFALAAILIICFWKKPKTEPKIHLLPIVICLLFYTLSYHFLPPLLRAVIAVSGLTFLLSNWRFERRFHFGIWSLFLLSLPIVASMQFYFGYPMRVIIGEATSILLKLNGLDVFREGVCLHFGRQQIWIDAPCSGVKMLWTGFFLAALLITIYDFRFKKSVLAFSGAFIVIILGNIFRATGLFYLEAGLVKMPEFAHQGIGVSSFILTCIGILFVINKIKQMKQSEPKTIELNSFTTKYKIIGLFIISIFALIVPFYSNNKNIIKTVQTAKTFPNELEGRDLIQLDLTEREQFFLNDFPGEVRRFTDGNREIIVRFVTEATRKLHPSSDCFSAIGYQIKPLPLRIDENQQKWACFSANRNENNLKVCERIYTNDGKSWTDVSSWYWSALSDNNPNGYWAITVAENTE